MAATVVVVRNLLNLLALAPAPLARCALERVPILRWGLIDGEPQATRLLRPRSERKRAGSGETGRRTGDTGMARGRLGR